MKRTNKTLLFFIMLSVIYLITSITYAYFTAIVDGSETDTTISFDAGKLEINYEGGPNISASNIYPDTEPFAVKNFTVTGTNTVTNIQNMEMSYSIYLKADVNTYTDGGLSYTLTGSNTGNNGEVANNLTRTDIRSGGGYTHLGSGKFTDMINNKSHDYTLNIYFYDTGLPQNENQQKSFDGRVIVDKDSENKFYRVNKPELAAGFTPVKFNGFTEIATTADDPEWHDYKNKKWANAKTDDGSYWVWIPRYAYKIKNCYHMNASECMSSVGKEAGDIEIKFLDGALDKTFDGEAVSLSPAYSGSAQTNFIKHPAFTFGADEIKGFWIGKFELSGTSSNVSVKPNVTSLGDMTIGDQFTTALNMKDDLKFGWNSSKTDTHMLKNIEWGAVAYLSQSIYGANEEVYINNSREYITGCSGNTASARSQAGCVNPWNTAGGVKASSTHNITGVYDMSGVAYEYVAAYSDTGHSNIVNRGQSLKNSYETYGSRYVDYYAPAGDNIYKPEYYGDAMYETSSSGNGTYSWYNDYSHRTDNISVFLLRGGYSIAGSAAGLFSFITRDGTSCDICSFRVAVVFLP